MCGGSVGKFGSGGRLLLSSREACRERGSATSNVTATWELGPRLGHLAPPGSERLNHHTSPARFTTNTSADQQRRIQLPQMGHRQIPRIIKEPETR